MYNALSHHAEKKNPPVRPVGERHLTLHRTERKLLAHRASDQPSQFPRTFIIQKKGSPSSSSSFFRSIHAGFIHDSPAAAAATAVTASGVIGLLCHRIPKIGAVVC